MKLEQKQKQKCQVCGCEFYSACLRVKYCPDCNKKLYTSPTQEEKRRRKAKKNKNQGLIDAVKKAAQLGISYGQYMTRVG